MSNTKPSWRDSLLKIFRAKDDAEREGALTELEAIPDDVAGGHSEGDGAVHHHIEINMPGAKKAEGESKPNQDTEGEEEEGQAMDEDKVKEIVGAVVAEALSPFKEAMEAIATKVDAMSAKADETSDRVNAVAEAVEDITDPDDMATQDAIARAEILAPGLSLPAHDAKPGSKSHRDAMAGFQRKALKQALTTDAGRAAVGAMLGHARGDLIERLPANEAAVAFRGASQMMLEHNASRSVETLASATAGYVRDSEGKRLRPMTTADMAKIHQDFYAQRRA